MLNIRNFGVIYVVYYVSALVTYKSYMQPWLLSYTSCQHSFEEAMKEIANVKNAFVVLSAWIDALDENNNKQTVFHECYVDTFGKISE